MKIGVIGTGLMGAPMVERLLSLGHAVIVFNRTREKAEALVEKGAVVAVSVAEVFNKAAVVILMLADGNAIEQMLFSDEMICFDNTTVIQMGTISPDESRHLASRITQRSGNYCECPVLGSIQEVREGNLILMFGGTAEQLDRWGKFLGGFGSTLQHIGDVPKAAAVKLALNQLIVSHIIGFSMSLGFIKKSGVDTDNFMDIVRASSLYAPMFDKKIPRLSEDDFTNPNFPVKHMLKDIALFAGACEQAGLNAESIHVAQRLFTQAVQQNLGELDYSAVYDIISPDDN